jgi:hypothetical protein
VVNLSSGTGFIPPTDVLVQVLPPLLLSGLGITIFVAPLTMALMTSVPERNAGVASALNNALSRVGPQLTGALIFVAVTATFFSGLGDRVPSLDVKSPEVRQAISPLNPPDESLPAATRAAVKESSTSSFALAMLLSAGMAVVGGLINLRIDNAQALKSSGSTTPAITVDPSTVTEANPEDED